MILRSPDDGGNPVLRYCNLMLQVRTRLDLIQALHEGRVDLGLRLANIQAMARQLRSVLQAMALGSLISHRKVFEAAHHSFGSGPRVRAQLREIERLHPAFYPVRALHERGAPVQEVDGFVALPDAFDRPMFEKAFERAAAIVDAKSPLGNARHFELFAVNALEWSGAIRDHLSCHAVEMYCMTQKHLIVLAGPAESVAHSIVLPDSDRASISGGSQVRLRSLDPILARTPRV